MKISKYIKVHKDVLLEYVYDDGNLISEPYKILTNLKDNINSFISYDTSGTYNTKNNQLFKIDLISGKYGKVDTNYYSFLQEKDYSYGIPIRYDTIKIHLPINYTFGEYLGCYIKVYTYGYDNKNIFELSNFYFDITDVSKSYLLNYTSPPLLFQEKLWGKHLKINIPALSVLSAQRVNGKAKENSINANLTNGIGLSTTAPIFIDFHFITKIQTLNGVTTFLMTPKTTATIPQSPEFEQLGLKIEHSKNGDFFEIYGTYNGSLAELDNFIKKSYELGNKYYVQYIITMFEENIKGKTITITVNNDFDEKIEYRPIIKYSTTTAIIDVEMRLIDSVDETYIVRKASYGMLQDEVSKYSLNLSKINIRNAFKPKIYNTRTAGFVINNNINIENNLDSKESFDDYVENKIEIQTVKVPFPVMIDRFNVMAKSDNVLYNKDKFYGIGKLLITIYPFDNIINFIIANDIKSLSDTTTIEYLDMTSMNNIQLEFKNSSTEVKIPLYRDAEIDLSIGQVAFKIPKSKIPDIRKIYESNNNVFYITSTSNDITTVIYTGLFKMYDSIRNINELNQNLEEINISPSKPRIIQDDSLNKETAIVTRRVIIENKETSKPIMPKEEISKKIDKLKSIDVKNINIKRKF